MSLENMRCDRCGELESTLFVVKEIQPEAWYCQGCMDETGREINIDTLALVNLLRRRRREK